MSGNFTVLGSGHPVKRLCIAIILFDYGVSVSQQNEFVLILDGEHLGGIWLTEVYLQMPFQ